MTDLERQLEASIKYVLMRKSVEALTARLAEVINENDHLRAELKLAELKLLRMARPRIVA